MINIPTKEELKDLCRKNSIKGFSNKSKVELKKLIKKYKKQEEQTSRGKYKKFLNVFDKHLLDKKEGKIEAGKFRDLVSEDVVNIGGDVPYYLEKLQQNGLIRIYKKTKGYRNLAEPLYPEYYRLYYIEVKRKNLHYYFDEKGDYKK